MTEPLGITELRHREQLARAMGGPERVARHRAQGKLTARERIELLSDPGTFQEFGLLAGESRYDADGNLIEFTPRAEVNGTIEIEGRPAVVNAGDFTVRGGAGGVSAFGFGRDRLPSERALETAVPFIRLLDASGGSVKSFLELGRTYRHLFLNSLR